ncbi:hypothetical protein IWZ03DRAFT_365269 [Phyllosticta citriasiana]|uniref:Uncharacterized protein n=1 Tax=Phyllosticta citriasiana TaxID=595635 RepID=A0ABR1L2D6_9PEZI
MRISSVSANSAILLLSFTTIVCGTGCDCPRGINHVQNQLQNLCSDKTCTWCGDVNGDAYGQSSTRVATRLREKLTSMGYRLYSCDRDGGKICYQTQGSNTNCHCETYDPYCGEHVSDG